MQWLLTTVLTALNTPAGIAAIAGIFLFPVIRRYTSRPSWQKYEGAIIAGIRFAEKQIPDDVENKGLARLDAALRYVLNVRREMNRRSAKPSEVADLRQGIQIMHNKLETGGVL